MANIALRHCKRRLSQIKALWFESPKNGKMWNSIQAPLDVPPCRDVRLAVWARGEMHALVFPCRREGDYWVDSKTGRRVEVFPTHWQEWEDGSQ